MRFFTSDHHFGHQNVIKYCNRPFDSIEAMNAYLIERWNSVVKPEDEVWHLGDFSLGKNAVRDITPLLNGNKILVAGNHDWCHPVQTKSKEARIKRAVQLYLDSGFGEVILAHFLAISGQIVHLSHMPPALLNQEDLRYPEHRPKRTAAPWFLHGHVHCAWRLREKCINVGVDVWDYTPVSEGKLGELIAHPGLDWNSNLQGVLL